MTVSLAMSAPTPARSYDPGTIRLLIVDDSLVARTVIGRMLERREEFTIVDSVADAGQALEVVRRQAVDIVLLDLEMPGVSGLELLPQLIEQSDGARVLVVSSSAAEGAQATLQALAAGAADTLQKPGVADYLGRFSDVLADRLIRIGKRKIAPASSHQPLPASKPISREPIDCLAIGASTGGLHALSELFANLPARFRAPILITQHLPASFMPYFADQMRAIAARSAFVASEGDILRPSTIWVAPGDGHIRLARGSDGQVRITIDRSPAVSNCLPSVDPMLESLGQVYGARGLAVVLSGMGRDGSLGARSVAAAGGEILAQDPETSVVWGMPGAVTGEGLASAVLSPKSIAGWITVRGCSG